jgi:protein-S-isoprenylcysteine O-methyltransferase Ste14
VVAWAGRAADSAVVGQRFSGDGITGMTGSGTRGAKLGTIAHYVGVGAEYCIVVLLAVWLSRVLGISAFPGLAFRVGGLALTGAGGCLVAWCCWLQFTVGQGTTGFSEPTRRLVTSGPYGVVRNPMMEGQFILFAGLGLLLDLAGMFLLLPLLALAIHGVTVLVEEPSLRGRFGQEWIDYASRVPRWFPRLGRADKDSGTKRS